MEQNQQEIQELQEKVALLEEKVESFRQIICTVLQGLRDPSKADPKVHQSIDRGFTKLHNLRIKS